MTTRWITLSLLLLAAACGSDASGGGGGSGGSSGTSGAAGTSGAGTGGTAGGGGMAGGGGGWQWECALTSPCESFRAADFQPAWSDLSTSGASSARCVFEALRDRTTGKYSWARDGFASTTFVDIWLLADGTTVVRSSFSDESPQPRQPTHRHLELQPASWLDSCVNQSRDFGECLSPFVEPELDLQSARCPAE